MPGANWHANLGSLPLGIRSSLSAWLTREPSYPVSKTSKIEHQVGVVFPSRLKSPMTSWRSNSQGDTSNLNLASRRQEIASKLGSKPENAYRLRRHPRLRNHGRSHKSWGEPEHAIPVPLFPQNIFSRNQPNHCSDTSKDTFPHLHCNNAPV